MVDESTLRIHQIELVVNAGHHFRDRRAVRDHAALVKIRYRVFLRFFSQMIKLYRARSRRDRSQILQPNPNFAAFFEIYKMSAPLHRCNLIFFAKFC